MAIFLAYTVFDSVRQPVAFDNTRKEREVKIVQNLKDIRSAQALFKQTYNRYTANFDSLAEYIKNGTLPIVNIIPDPNDTTFTKTINDTVGYIKVIDSLFKNRENFDADNLKVIPYSQNKTFEAEAGYITRGGLKVGVFEVKAPYKTYLWDLDEQRVRNLIAEQEQLERYPGVKVGSMSEPSVDGNWE